MPRPSAKGHPTGQSILVPVPTIPPHSSATFPFVSTFLPTFARLLDDGLLDNGRWTWARGS